MNRKRVGIILVVIGLLLAVGIGAVVYMQTEQATEIAKRTPTVEVVVAAQDLPERVAVPEVAVKVMKVPAEVAAASAATKPADVVGRYPLVPIYQGEIIMKPKLADSAGKTGPAFVLKEGMVAATLAGSDLLNGTGAIRAGDKVDLLMSLSLTPPVPTGPAAMSAPPPEAPSIPIVSQKMLQNLEVLHVGTFAAAGQPEGQGAGKSITFQVSHQDALILKWAKDSGGVIDMVLRHPADNEPVETEPIALDYIFSQFKFRFAEAPRIEAPR